MIRIATEADVPEILEIYAPYILTTTCSFEYTVPTEAEFLERFRNITRQFPWLVWEEEGKILGYAYGSLPFERAAYQWCCESSIYLRPEARGRGIGRRLNLALEAIFTIQGYKTNYAIITSENSVSLDFHRKLGYIHAAEFENCGYKFGRWMGVIWLKKDLSPIPNNPVFPTSWTAIMNCDKNFPYILDILSLS